MKLIKEASAVDVLSDIALFTENNELSNQLKKIIDSLRENNVVKEFEEIITKRFPDGIDADTLVKICEMVETKENNSIFIPSVFLVDVHWTIGKNYDIEAATMEEAEAKMNERVDNGKISYYEAGYQATDDIEVKCVGYINANGERVYF